MRGTVDVLCRYAARHRHCAVRLRRRCLGLNGALTDTSGVERLATLLHAKSAAHSSVDAGRAVRAGAPTADMQLSHLQGG